MAATACIHLCLTYINTKDNPADAPSRGIAPQGYTRGANAPGIPGHLDAFFS